MKTMAVRRAELYEHIADRAAEVARDLGVAAELAEHLGHAIVDAFVEDVGGEVLSFPKDDTYKLSKREMEILAAHREGASFAELSKRYGMSDRGMRKLIKRAQSRNQHLDQGKLFEQ